MAHIKSEIDAYLAGGLSESKRQEVERHVHTCEACRKALHKARTRQAHDRREALKRASESIPNLMITRLARQTPMAPTSPMGRWILLLVLLSAGAYAWYRFKPHIETMPARTVSNEMPSPGPEVAGAIPEVIPEPSVVVSSPTVPRRRRVAPVVSSETVSEPVAPISVSSPTIP